MVILIHFFGMNEGMIILDDENYSLQIQEKVTDKHRKEPDALSLAAAASTLSCLMTPGCFPSHKCNEGIPQKLKRRKYWEEHSFCVQELVKTNRRNKRMKKDPCLVYSFGVYDSVEWEKIVESKFGCEVHAFDPVVNITKMQNRAKGVTVHQIGLQGVGTDMSETNGIQYDKIDHKRLLPLDQIMKRLGHENRTLDILKLDCEGCEWGVLRQLACNADDGDQAIATQMLIEFHFQKNLGIYSDHDLIIAAEAVNCLRQKRWGITAMEDSGCYVNDAQYTDSMLEIIPSASFLLYVTLQQKPLMKETMATLPSNLTFPEKFYVSKNRHFFNRIKGYDNNTQYEEKNEYNQ